MRACFGLVIGTGPRRFREVGPDLVRLCGLCFGMAGLCESEGLGVHLSGCPAYPETSAGGFDRAARYGREPSLFRRMEAVHRD